jgi:hypothetical protein
VYAWDVLLFNTEILLLQLINVAIALTPGETHSVEAI